MAEAIAAVGFAASIVQFIIFGSRILAQLKELEASVSDTPKVFRSIEAELPLLIDTLGKTKEKAESGDIAAKTQKALLPVIEGCTGQIKVLDEMISKLKITAEDSSWRKSRKIWASVWTEKKVQTVVETLKGYVQILTYHQAVSLSGSAKTSASYEKPESIFTVPFERDQKLISRPELTSKLLEALAAGPRAALAGIGGVGKTQVVVEHCYRYRQQDPSAHVFWVHAGTLSRTEQAYKQIARKLSLPRWDDPSQNTFEIVSDWLDEHTGWLLVLDNADDLDLFFGENLTHLQGKQLYEYLPNGEGGKIIITTRDIRVASRLLGSGDPIIVSPMDFEDANSLLKSRIILDRNLDLGATELAELFEALGSLPLAITQAAAYITENNITASEYLEVLRANQSEVEDLLGEEVGDRQRYSESGNSILGTLKLSFNQIAKQKPLAADILSLMAFLDCNGIPRSLLKQQNIRTVDFVSALGTLQAFSLIKSRCEGANFDMHRLVQISTQRWLYNTRSKWQDRAIAVLSENFPRGDYSNWKECEKLAPHALVAIEYDASSLDAQERRATILHNLARFDGEQSRYELAEKKFTEVAAIREKLLGIDHPDTLTSMSHLGEYLFLEGKYAQAESVTRRVITESENLFGPKSEEALFNTSILAQIIQGYGRMEEAECLFRKALEGDGKVLPDIITMHISNEMGAVLRDQRKYDEAEFWIRKGLEGRHRLLGPVHPNVSDSTGHLAETLSLMDGRLDEAEMLGQRAVAVAELVIGHDHRLTARNIHTLGGIMIRKGQYDIGAEFCRDAYERYCKVLGQGDRGTLRCLRSLASIEEQLGRYAEAEALFEQVVQGNVAALGEDHCHTLDSARDLERVRMARKMEVANMYCLHSPERFLTLLSHWLVLLENERGGRTLLIYSRAVSLERRPNATSRWAEPQDRHILNASISLKPMFGCIPHAKDVGKKFYERGK